MSESPLQSESYVIGLDTSCYTTSVAVVHCYDKVLHDGRQMLDVKPGELGLRQSDAFFKHVQNLPELIEELFKVIHEQGVIDKIRAVAVSTRPRHVEGSYMPVFTAGQGYARTLAVTLGVPLIETDHQSGHIMAGSLGHSSLLKGDRPFVALHMSGGTTEIVRCTYHGQHFSEEIIGGTKDLSMGSLIDRLGVKCGLPFPSGKPMELAVLKAIEENGEIETLKFPINHQSGWFNLSGMEAYGLKYWGNVSSEQLYYSLFKACSTVLCKALQYTCAAEAIEDVLVVGGVASNSYIRSDLLAGLTAKGIRVHFAKPNLSTDNAVGVAALGCHQLAKIEGVPR